MITERQEGTETMTDKEIDIGTRKNIEIETIIEIEGTGSQRVKEIGVVTGRGKEETRTHIEMKGREILKR